MQKDKSIKLFEEKTIRTHWDEDAEKWYFSIVDVVSVLVDSIDYLTARKYWNKLKQRLVEEGNETVTNCHQLKMWLAQVGADRIDETADPELAIDRAFTTYLRKGYSNRPHSPAQTFTPPSGCHGAASTIRQLKIS